MSVLKNVVIVGGGAAGWLTSLHVKKILPESNITLIESEDIGILGAGEGSVPTLVQFLKDLEIDEDEFIRETNATHKLGILFKNWNGDDKSYFHSFNVAHQQFDFMFDDDGEIGNPYIGYLYDNNLPFNIGEISEQFAMRFKSPYVKQKVNNTKQVANYSYHFDAHLLANFLRKVAESRGIVRVEGIVEDFIQNDNKDIIQIKTKDTTIPCDFVFDCSGFKRLIIGGVYKSPWKSYIKQLKANTALTFQVPQFKTKIEPYTQATSFKNGWLWEIPLQNRIGCGYVFDENYISVDEAKVEIEEYIGREIEINNVIKFNAGAYEKVWFNNCIAIGLSSAFTEPIEATSIFNAINQLLGISKNVIENYNNDLIQKYNDAIFEMNENVLDFLYFHYITKRNDSKFWSEYLSTTEKPKSFEILMENLKTNLYSCNDFVIHPFSYHSWLQVGFGLDLLNKELFINDYKKTDEKRIKEHILYLKKWSDFLIQHAHDEKEYLDNIVNK
jgi:tryptophan halogenase